MHPLRKKRWQRDESRTDQNEANSVDADLIVTTIDPEVGITDYMMGVDEQKIVANESQIPVLCINIKNFMSKSGNIFEYTF